MPLDEATLDRQLARAKEDLAGWAKALEGRGVATADRRRNPTWRKLNSVIKGLRIRLKAVATVYAREEEAVKRKADKLTAPVIEKEPKHSPKEAKAKKEAKAAAKEKGPAKKSEKGAETKEKKKKG